jgi:hypothetical protein
VAVTGAIDGHAIEGGDPVDGLGGGVARELAIGRIGGEGERDRRRRRDRVPGGVLEAHSDRGRDRVAGFVGRRRCTAKTSLAATSALSGGGVALSGGAVTASGGEVAASGGAPPRSGLGWVEFIPQPAVRSKTPITGVVRAKRPFRETLVVMREMTAPSPSVARRLSICRLRRASPRDGR